MPTRNKTSFITVFSDSAEFFKKLRWSDGKKICIRCGSDTIYTLKTGRLRCKICGLTFGDFTGTFIGQLNIPINEIAHLLYLFSLGLPVYRCRHYITISMKTAHRAYTVFRRVIYDQSEKDFTKALDKSPRIKKTLHSRFKIDFSGSWEADDNQVFFGIVVISGSIYAFPITVDEKSHVLKFDKPLQRRPLLYNTDDGFSIATIPVSESHLILQRMMFHRSGKSINTKVESFWSYLHEQLYHYHGISIPYYHLYIKESEYRFRNRAKDLFLPLAKMLVKPSTTVLKSETG